MLKVFTILRFLMFISIISFSFSQNKVINIFVSPNGNDKNSGSIDKPLFSLIKARDKIRTIKKNLRSDDIQIVVYLRGGEYFLDSTFCLFSEDSGFDKYPIIYSAYKNEKPILIGGKYITNWKLLDKHLEGVKPEMIGKIYYAKVSPGWHFHYLYLNDKPQKLARKYNEDEWYKWPKPKKVGDVSKDGQLLQFNEGELNYLSKLDGQIEIDLMPVNFWNTISVLKGIDENKSIAYRHSKNPTTFWKDSFQEGNYNLLNSITFIDEPGEWAVDSKEGIVYYYPEKELINSDIKILAPKLYRIIHLKGDEINNQFVKNIKFEGIEFRYTDRMAEDLWPDEWVKRQAELPDGMIYIENAKDIEITKCKFFYSGSYGVDLEKYSQNIRIIYNEMGYMGCGGVLLQGYGPGLKDVNKNNIISRNNFYYTGQGGYKHSAAITLYQSGSNEISYNIISHIPYVGVQICSANWDAYNQSEYNQNVDKNEPGGVDSYGNAKAQYYTIWEDLPKDKSYKFTRENFKIYLHTTNNKIHHNIILDYLEKLSDGAPLYSWSSGMGNLYYENVMKRRDIKVTGQKWIFGIYMDDFVDGAVLFNNIIWGYADPDNIFHNKGLNMWSNNVHSFPEKPKGYDEQLNKIINEGQKKGGWLGELPEELKAY